MMPDSNGGGFSVMAPMLATHFDTQCGSFSNLILLCVLISITGVDTLLFVIYTYWALNGILFDFSIISLNVFIRGVARRGTACRLLEDKKFQRFIRVQRFKKKHLQELGVSLLWT